MHSRPFLFCQSKVKTLNTNSSCRRRVLRQRQTYFKTIPQLKSAPANNPNICVPTTRPHECMIHSLECPNQRKHGPSNHLCCLVPGHKKGYVSRYFTPAQLMACLDANKKQILLAIVFGFVLFFVFF